MKKLFIETRYRGEIKLTRELIEELPQKIVLATPVQLIDYITEIKEKLEARGKKVFLFESQRGRYPGQILGCDNFKIKPELNRKIEAFLYFGEGSFHPEALLVNEKPVFCYHPLTQKIKKYDQKEKERKEIKRKTALLKFYSAKRIGLLFSLKPGQKTVQIRGPINLKKILETIRETKGKEIYLFLGRDIRKEDLENFNFIDCWVNTACPRLVDDIPYLVNLRDLVENDFSKINGRG